PDERQHRQAADRQEVGHRQAIHLGLPRQSEDDRSTLGHQVKIDLSWVTMFVAPKAKKAPRQIIPTHIQLIRLKAARKPVMTSANGKKIVVGLPLIQVMKLLPSVSIFENCTPPAVAWASTSVANIAAQTSRT